MNICRSFYSFCRFTKIVASIEIERFFTLFSLDRKLYASQQQNTASFSRCKCYQWHHLSSVHSLDWNGANVIPPLNVQCSVRIEKPTNTAVQFKANNCIIVSLSFQFTPNIKGKSRLSCQYNSFCKHACDTFQIQCTILLLIIEILAISFKHWAIEQIPMTISMPRTMEHFAGFIVATQAAREAI